MKTVNIHKAKTTLCALLAEMVGLAPHHPRRAGILREVPEWRSFLYDPGLFAPRTDAELAEEGWE